MPPLLGSEEAGLGSVLTAAGGTEGGGPATGDPVAIANFTGMIVGAEGTNSAYLANPGTQQALAEGVIELHPQLYPTSARTFERLTVTTTNGNGGTPYTVTLYRNGAPTAQTVTVPAGAAAGAVFTDSAHPISFSDDDKYDVFASKAGSGDSAALMAVTLEGPTGAGGGAGDFPGYGPAPPGVLAASAPGVSALVSRADHTHAGVASVTSGGSGLMEVSTIGDAVVVDTGQLFANGINTGAAQLATIPTDLLNTGQLCFVNSVGAYFWLQVSALATDGITVVAAASGSPTRQWLRIDTLNRIWAARTTWWIDPQNVAASDENDGATSATPLKTFAEHARRLYQVQIAANVTVNCVSDAVAGDGAYYTIRSGTNRMNFVGTTTAGAPLYTGTVTSFTPQATTLAADDNELTDSTIPVSFTASGLLAVNLLFKKTNGTAAYWYGAADLGSKTLRTSTPVNVTNNAITNPVAGDTYAVYKLPQLPALSFARDADTRGVNFTEVAIAVSAVQIFQAWGVFTRCFFNVGTNAPAFEASFSIQNCAFDYGAATQGPSFTGGGFLVSAIAWGMHRSSGGVCALQFFGQAWNTQGSILQGCVMFVASGGFLNIQGRTSVYDTTAANICWADYWSSVLFSAQSIFGVPGIAGKNNTGKLLAVLNWSNMAYSTGFVPTVAGASTDPNPISIGTVSSPVSALPINKTLANDIGIFATS